MLLRGLNIRRGTQHGAHELQENKSSGTGPVLEATMASHWKGGTGAPDVQGYVLIVDERVPSIPHLLSILPGQQMMLPSTTGFSW